MSKRRAPIGQTLGGILAGIDQQILRSTPPPHELVRKGEALRGVTGQDGSDLAITLPDAERGTPDAQPDPDPLISFDGRRRFR
jgi:hypothetical protein